MSAVLSAAQHTDLKACCAAQPEVLGAIFNGGLITAIKNLIAKLGPEVGPILQELIASGTIPAAFAPFIEILIALLAAQPAPAPAA